MRYFIKITTEMDITQLIEISGDSVPDVNDLVDGEFYVEVTVLEYNLLRACDGIPGRAIATLKAMLNSICDFASDPPDGKIVTF